ESEAKAETGAARRPASHEQGLEFQMDEEISISPTSGAQPKTPADILAGAESELEKTAKATHSMSDFDPPQRRRLPVSGAAVAAAMDAGTPKSEPTTSAADKVAAARDDAIEAQKFDLDFKLEDGGRQ